MTRVTKNLFSFAAAAILLATSARAQDTKPSTEEAIINIVHSAANGLTPDNFIWATRWNSDQKIRAYNTLRDRMGPKPKGSDGIGNEWSDMIDAVGLLGGSTPEVSREALKALERFATNDFYFGTTVQLPEDSHVVKAALEAKRRVPLAIAMFAYSAVQNGNEDMFYEARSVLVDWSDRKTGGIGVDSELSTMLAKSAAASLKWLGLNHPELQQSVRWPLTQNQAPR